MNKEREKIPYININPRPQLGLIFFLALNFTCTLTNYLNLNEMLSESFFLYTHSMPWGRWNTVIVTCLQIY